MEEKRLPKQQTRDILHNIILENRQKLSVSGIEEVESFNEEEIILRILSGGVLIVKGYELHVNKLNVDTGDISITGEVSGMDYVEQSAKAKGPGLLSRLLR